MKIRRTLSSQRAYYGKHNKLDDERWLMGVEGGVCRGRFGSSDWNGGSSYIVHVGTLCGCEWTYISAGPLTARPHL